MGGLCEQAGKVHNPPTLPTYLRPILISLPTYLPPHTNTQTQHSLKEEMDSLATLVIRWRKIELETWPDLLEIQVRRGEAPLSFSHPPTHPLHFIDNWHVPTSPTHPPTHPPTSFFFQQERQVAARAVRYWLHLHRLTRQAIGGGGGGGGGGDREGGEGGGEVEGEEEGGGGEDRGGDRGSSTTSWLLHDLEPPSSSHPPTHPPSISPDLRALFDSLDLLMRGSPLGEYQARLSLLRAFAIEFTTHPPTSSSSSEGGEGGVAHGEGGGRRGGGGGGGECSINLPPSPSSSSSSSSLPISRMLALLVSYYTQHLPLIQSTLSSHRAPLEKRLKDEAKLCRWDDQVPHPPTHPPTHGLQHLIQTASFSSSFPTHPPTHPPLFLLQTYHALKESTGKSHRRLLKILREHR